MCLVCNHEESPEGGFRTSYLCGVVFASVSVEAGGPGILSPIILGFCDTHRRMYTVIKDAFDRTGTARVLANRRAKKMVISEACVAAIRLIAADTEGDLDPHGMARVILEAEEAS